MRIFISILLFSLATIANSQSYPDYSTTAVNDFSNLLSPETEALLGTHLKDLKDDTGIEMTVVTLSRRNIFTENQTLEDFATGLFNHWGIGDKTRNDGVLVLVMHQDREMRVELGKAFGQEWNGVAEMVIDRSFLPLFKQEDYDAGIEKGVKDVIKTIARPFSARSEPPETPSKSPSNTQGIWWVLISIIPFGLVIFFKNIKDLFGGMASCPKCGQRRLSIHRKTTEPASTSNRGHGERITDCSNCDYHNVDTYTISKRSKSSSRSGSSFGGGSSGGGGASGRW